MDIKSAKIVEILSKHLSAKENNTKNRIILASKKRFLEEGFSRITIGDICHNLKISKKTFYKHFDHKEDLVVAILGSNFKIFIPRFIEIFQSDESAEYKFDHYLKFMTKDFPQNVTTPFVADIQILMPEVWEAIDEFRKRILAGLVDIIRDGQKEGVFHDNFDPDVASKFIMLLLQRVLDPKVLFQNEINISDFVGFLSTLIDRGIRVPPEEREKEK